MFLFPSLLDFITEVSTTLPSDVSLALQKARVSEKNTNGQMAIDIIEKNISMAEKQKVPLCQDTGFPTFYISHSTAVDTAYITNQITTAMRMATKKGTLRPNSVDSISGKNSGDNSGEIFPKLQFIHDSLIEKDCIKVSLILKGGGCENVSGQMALPAQTEFGRANRDMDGVEKAVLDIVQKAEGKGCAPAIIGVHVGGDRSVGFEQAKKNLFRELGTKNKNQALQILEEKIMTKANGLDIGPMGFGGNTTLLDCFCSTSNRLPASFFVTVSYNCWALRRGSVTLDLKSGKKSLEVKDDISKNTKEENLKQNRKEVPELNFSTAKKLSLPLDNSDINSLEKGDMVLLSGTIYTGRDSIHHMVAEENKSLPIDIAGSAIYHCGPIMKQQELNGKTEWKCISAGPTTSIREEPFQADFIEKTGIKAVIGKGNMGEKTLASLRKNNAVYLHAIGGAAAVYAKCVTKVSDVFFLEELGMPEAMWQMEVKDFPVMVTMK